MALQGLLANTIHCKNAQAWQDNFDLTWFELVSLDAVKIADEMIKQLKD